MQQAGVAGYNVAIWNALAAPAGTPPEVVDALNRAVREAVASPAVQAKTGASWACGCRAARRPSCRPCWRSEIQRWGEVIRAAKIEPE